MTNHPNRKRVDIVIRTVGNPSLYQSLQDSIASETRHRTVSGALRRLEEIEKLSARWAKNMGKWGNVEILTNGTRIDRESESSILGFVGDYTTYPLNYHMRRFAEDMLLTAATE